MRALWARLAPQLVAALVALHLLAIVLQGLPAVGGGMSKRDWANPTVQGEFAAWTARLDSLGVELTPQELEDGLWGFATGYTAARKRVLAPFMPYYTYAGTWQSWRMFVAPHRYPSVLHIDVLRDRQWQTVYVARSAEHDWLAPKLDHDRFRAAVFRYGWKNKFKRDYSDFANWVTRQAARDFPDATQVRVRFFTTRTRSPEETRAGVEVEGEFINIRLRQTVSP